MLSIGERLKTCRKAVGKTQKDMALFLGVSERAYQHYELNTHDPQLSNAVSLANFFNCSLDYLTGRTDNPEINQ